MVKPKKIAIVGYGAVGRAFAQALSTQKSYQLRVFEKEKNTRYSLAEKDGFKPDTFEHIKADFDLIVIAVSDLLIAEVATSLALEFSKSYVENKTKTVMHFSGRLGLDVLNPLSDLGYSRLAFHPIQTFPHNADGKRFNNITVGVTADELADETAVELAEDLSVKILRVKQDKRAEYHHASVLASNFLPLLLDLGAKRLEGIASDYESAWKALLPLVRGMVDSMEKLGPHSAMTGPVVRNDYNAVEEHIKEYSDSDGRELYLHMTHELVKMAHKAGKKSEEELENWEDLFKKLNQKQEKNH